MGRGCCRRRPGLRWWPRMALGAAIVMLLLITVLASLIPARRAAGLDPNQALRDL